MRIHLVHFNSSEIRGRFGCLSFMQQFLSFRAHTRRGAEQRELQSKSINIKKHVAQLTTLIKAREPKTFGE